jgi:heme-degrading monooxygenase HmoA
MIANTPKPPYYAVIFTSEQAGENAEYKNTAERMIELAKDQEGFLGMESAREDIGITVSYWKNTDAIRKWKMNAEHQIAQQKGKAEWYSCYKTRICLVERDYEFNK